MAKSIEDQILAHVREESIEEVKLTLGKLSKSQLDQVLQKVKKYADIPDTNLQ